MTELTVFEICIPTSIQTRARGGAQPTIAPKRGTEELRAPAVKERVYRDWTHILRDVHPNIDPDESTRRIAAHTCAETGDTEESRATAMKERVYRDWTHRLRDVHPNINVDTAAKQFMRDEWPIIKVRGGAV